MSRESVIAEIKVTLIERDRKLRDLLNGDLNSLRRADGRTVAVDDISSAAADASENEVNCALAEAESNELGKIAEALQKIELNTFGACEDCGNDIPLARLEALPYAVRCLSCQAIYEKESAYSPPRRKLKKRVEEEE